MDYRLSKGWRFRHIMSIPFIYCMVLPLVALDFSVTIYHHVAFRLYGLPFVDRWAYIRIDRHKLKYLTIIERVHCAYCGYANGLLRYACEIGARTEKYWCGIKHKPGGGFVEPEYQAFLPMATRRLSTRNFRKLFIWILITTVK